MVGELEVGLQISALRNLRNLRRGFLVIDNVWILMPYGKRVSNRRSAVLSMGREKNSDHGGSRAQQGYSPGSRGSSVRGGGSVTFFFLLLFSGHWRGSFLYLLHCQTALLSFHCHQDFVTAASYASTICHKGASCTRIEWSRVIHRKNRNNDTESFWGARAMG